MFRWSLLPLVFLLGTALAAPLPPEQVPDPLRTWIPWVLHGQEQARCPFLYQDGDSRQCAWPGRLELQVSGNGGRFQMAWRAYAPGFLPLPGDVRIWPVQTTLDGKPVAVVERDGLPQVYVEPGSHALAGRFEWNALPESLPVPAAIGLLALNRDGAAVFQPRRDEDGRLWLREPGVQEGFPEAAIQIKVFRLVDDANPLLLTTRLFLDVSGPAREINLPPAMPEGLVPLSVDASLPARWEKDGSLRLQVRPGQWSVDLVARSTGPLDGLVRLAAAAPWPADEVWSFQAHRDLRLVEVEGAPSIDPSQAGVPTEWHAYPAYAVAAGGGLVFRVLRRGDPEPEPDALTLQRRLWLDFDGGGYTVSDELSGKVSRSWRLESEGGLQPGRVAVDGEPRLITRLPGGKGPGVELRQGRLNLSADSRLEGSIRHIPALGWDQDVRRLVAELRLPPGWRLLGATGVDQASDSWIARWTLLDLFAVLILALAVGRLWGAPWALAALAAFGLMWQEPDAPRFVWLHLIAAIALLRVVPPGRFRSLAMLYRNLAWLAVFVVALPFMADQLRQGIYPQLESKSQPVWERAMRAIPTAPAGWTGTAKQAESGVVSEPAEMSLAPSSKAEAAMDAGEPPRATPPRLLEVDPSAKVQAGPGVPDWDWHRVTLVWNGPVTRGQTLNLYLLSPAVTLTLNILRVALLLLLAARLADRIPGRWWPGSGAIAVGLWVTVVFLASPPAFAEGLPDDARLESLRQRLLEPSDCLPRCADLSSLRIDARPERLALVMEWHAQQAVAVPLPLAGDEWLPEATRLDSDEARVVRRDDGQYWLDLPAGVHTLMLEGRLASVDRLRLPLPLPPHRVAAQLDGWLLEGVGEDGEVEAQLRLLRREPSALILEHGLAPSPLPPFVRLERTLELGLDWRVHNRLLRISPPGTAVSLAIPLLQGESVTTPGLTVADGKLAMNLLPRQDELHWDSVLEKTGDLTLQAPSTDSWHEVWELNASAIWHVQWEGIAPAHHLGEEGRWAPRWYPWAGERVILHLTRPEGVAGATLALDGSRLAIKPGETATDVRLELTLRSSLGGQHALKLPDGAELLSVSLDGAAQPIRAKGREVVLPLHPGSQQAVLEWREPAGIGAWFRASAVDLGSPSVNSRITVAPGRDRWILAVWGPQLGPAVLVWGLLIVLILVAAALGRIPWTPLRVRHWLLLLLGFTQSSIAAGMLVVGWLLALGLRAGRAEPAGRWFNAGQIALGIYTVLALALLFNGVSDGLLGTPDMGVTGNGSSAELLQWYQDRSTGELPRPGLFSLPLYAYRAAMLAWALWLAWSLLDWLRWGWGCFAAGGLWRPKVVEADAMKKEQ